MVSMIAKRFFLALIFHRIRTLVFRGFVVEASGVVPVLVSRVPGEDGRGGYAARMLPLSPAMPVPGCRRRGRLFHDHGLFTVLFAVNNP
jgi:hypothetical protein